MNELVFVLILLCPLFFIAGMLFSDKESRRDICARNHELIKVRARVATTVKSLEQSGETKALSLVVHGLYPYPFPDSYFETAKEDLLAVNSEQ